MTTPNVRSEVSVFVVDTNWQHALLPCAIAMANSNSCNLRADRCPQNISFPCHQLQAIQAESITDWGGGVPPQ